MSVPLKHHSDPLFHALKRSMKPTSEEKEREKERKKIFSISVMPSTFSFSLFFPPWGTIRVFFHSCFLAATCCSLRVESKIKPNAEIRSQEQSGCEPFDITWSFFMVLLRLLFFLLLLSLLPSLLLLLVYFALVPASGVTLASPASAVISGANIIASGAGVASSAWGYAASRFIRHTWRQHKGSWFVCVWFVENNKRK